MQPHIRYTEGDPQIAYQVLGTRVCTSSALPITCSAPPSSCLRAATAWETSPCSNVEFRHASGSVRVVEATYFGSEFNGSRTTASSSDAVGH